MGDNVRLDNCKFYFGDGNNNIHIGSNCVIHNVEFIERYKGNNNIIIGNKTTFGGKVQIEASEGTTVIIGNDCMFAHDIRLMTTDHHTITNEKGERFNNPNDIIIGEHVWIGTGVFIMKGSDVPNGCIIGANSTYTLKKGKVYENTIYSGNPAVPKKEKVFWHRELI